MEKKENPTATTPRHEQRSLAGQIIEDLMGIGFVFTLEGGGHEMSYEYRGVGTPNMELVNRLMSDLAALKPDAIKYLLSRQIERSRLYADPRPELDEKYGDGLWWSILLEEALKGSSTLYANLRQFRVLGTVFVETKDRRRVLRPLIGSDPYPYIAGWQSKEEYDEQKKLHLEPYKEILLKALERVNRHEVMRY